MLICIYEYLYSFIYTYSYICLIEYLDTLIFYYEYILILIYLFMPIFRPPDGPRMRYSEGTPFRLGCWLGLDRMGLVGGRFPKNLGLDKLLVGVNISPDGD